MPFVMAEVALQKLIQYGIRQLRSDKASFDEVFGYLIENELMSVGYGQSFVDRLWEWFTTEKLPVVQSWSLSPQRIPCYSIHLAAENEDETKAAISDHYGEEEENDIGVSSFNVTVDLGIHASKSADEVLWMYYLLSYILFKSKPVAQSLGLEIQTFSASDWAKEVSKVPENIYTRWVRMRFTVFHTWEINTSAGPYDVETFVDFCRLGDSSC